MNSAGYSLTSAKYVTPGAPDQYDAEMWAAQAEARAILDHKVE
jgi:hypothetical protein